MRLSGRCCVSAAECRGGVLALKWLGEPEMNRALSLGIFAFGIATVSAAADIQGVIVDWNCARRMAENGRAKVLMQDRSCSLVHHYLRAAYGILTSDKKYYRLDEAGNKWAQTLLKDSPDKDNLQVVVRGDIEDDTIHVKNMTEL